MRTQFHARRCESHFRKGYTLLEVLLASAIGMFLLAGLYFAIETHLRLAHAGRDLGEHAMLVRSLLGRIASDVSAHVAPQSNAGSGSSSSSSTSSSTTSPSPTPAPTTGGTSTPSTGTGATAASATTPGPQPNIGVQGDNTRLTVYISRVPRELNFGLQPDDAPPVVSDLRRVTYWLAGDSGLARQEIKMVTSDDENSALPPDIGDPAPFIIAPEVTSLTFSYWDGTAWQDSWDGTTLGSDGKTPIGPPMAIAINMDVRLPNTGGETRQGDPQTTTYRRVVFIPTSNGTAQTSDTTSGSTTSSGTTTGP